MRLIISERRRLRATCKLPPASCWRKKDSIKRETIELCHDVEALLVLSLSLSCSFLCWSNDVGESSHVSRSFSSLISISIIGVHRQNFHRQDFRFFIKVSSFECLLSRTSIIFHLTCLWSRFLLNRLRSYQMKLTRHRCTQTDGGLGNESWWRVSRSGRLMLRDIDHSKASR